MKYGIIQFIPVFLWTTHAVLAQNYNLIKSEKPVYIDTILPFSNNIAIFLNDKHKWGAINKNGEIIIKPKYELLSNFHEGLATFWVNLEYNGYLNRKGEEVHKGSYNAVGDFEDGLSEVWLHKIGQKFEKGNYENNPFNVRRNFLDHSFKLLVPYKYDSVAVYRNGKVRLVSRKGKFGFLDQKAQEIVPLILDDVDVDSAYYWCEYRRISYAGKFGFLNTNTGKWFIQPTFKNTLPSTSSITWVEDTLGWSLINQDQQLLTRRKYTEVHWVVPGRLAAAGINHGFFLIDQFGRQLTSKTYDNIYTANEGVSVVLKNGRYGYINEKGHEIVAPIYEKAAYFHDGKGFIFGKYAYLFIDRTGKETIDRLKPVVLVGLFFSGLIIFITFFILRQKYGRSRYEKKSIP